MRLLRIVGVALAASALLAFPFQPVATSAASTPPVMAIDAGRWHSCALTSAGGVECWGGGDGLPGNADPDAALHAFFAPFLLFRHLQLARWRAGGISFTLTINLALHII